MANDPAPDLITIEILHNTLKSITDEMFVALMKSSYSTNIKERRDHSTTIIDRNGKLIAQAEFSLPIHLGSLLGLVDTIIASVPLQTIREGDIFIANDPHVAGGTHLPDVNMAMPVFSNGRIVAFVCNIAHHADMGGMAPGSMAGGMSEIYQEGLRVPLVRLFKAGEIDQDILSLLLLNVRVPEERRGDYFAQIAACKLGARRLGEVVARYGIDVLEATFEDIIQRTEARLRSAFAQLPSGRYRFADYMDDDGLGTTDIPIVVEATISADRLVLDFRGSSPQVAGNINCTLSATRAAACYSVKALLDPDIPNNHGVINAVEIIVDEGSILSAVYPAAVASRAHTCQRVIDAIIGCFAEVIPDKVVAAANGANTTAVFSGTDPRSGKEFVYLETLGGGFGGRATRDGRDGVQVHITNTSNLPVESIESEYPLLVESYGFVEDSGGAGRQRGGLGIRRVLRPAGAVATFSGTGERFRHSPWGLFGGKPGKRGRFAIRDDDGTVHELPGKAPSTRFKRDQCVIIETPGAGGYGSPVDRAESAIAEDLQSGKFSAAFVDEHYRKAAPGGD